MPRKKTTKKKATKKSTSTQKKRKTLKRIPKDQYFVLADGTKVGHYLSLADVLEKVEESVLSHHVTELKNDFASWIHDVFEEKELAKLVEDAKSPEEIRLHIYKYVIKQHIRR